MFLITLFLKGDAQTWIRNLLWEEEPPCLKEDMEIYYRDFLGVKDLEISFRIHEVPKTFPMSLLGPSEPSRSYPMFDKEIHSDQEKEKYLALVDRMVEMERMRVECGIGMEPASVQPVSAQPVSAQPYESWIHTVLETLQQQQQQRQKEDTIPIPDDATIAWILTPVLEHERVKKGCRILTDGDLGRVWASRLGTELYPDLVVCRRLSTCRWRIRNRHADILAKTAIEWYVAGQSMAAGPLPGLSTWIQQADEDLASVLLPFENVGPSEPFHRPPRADVEENDTPTHPLTKILQALEGTHVLCSLTHTNIYVPTKEQWVRYLRHVFRMHGILSSLIDSNWQGVEDCIVIWIQGGQGVDVGAPALFEKWRPIWSMLSIERDSVPIATKFEEFLTTLDLHVPMTAIGLQTFEKMDIANVWVQIFIDRELVEDSEGILHASVLYDAVRTFVFRYCPQNVVESVLQPTSLAPYFKSHGYEAARTKKGRFITGLRYKNPELWVPAHLLHEKVRKRQPQPKKKETAQTSILESLQMQTQNESKNETFCLEEEDGVIHLGTF